MSSTTTHEQYCHEKTYSLSNLKRDLRQKCRSLFHFREYLRTRKHSLPTKYFVSDTSHWTTRSCEIQTLYVSFKDLEWQVSFNSYNVIQFYEGSYYTVMQVHPSFYFLTITLLLRLNTHRSLFIAYLNIEIQMGKSYIMLTRKKEFKCQVQL